ncbi:Desert hedgehog protein B [Clonorchis sinensis]|uniref:Desert hedgehog protein B n=1 Tax=Clonorchis sinensis TaxID=79923 RepID=A0A8T1MSX7_CLOSI|nr:Desert hedgehog protein B [Clonorchis sinensis]
MSDGRYRRLTPVTAFHLLPIIFLMTNSVHGCFKSSLYYRHKVRSRSHVFAPGEYQPVQMEHTTDGSGPLDARDFHHSIPNRRLVRVESPHIVFDSEEARWMSEGCRDRLLKLSTQIQNTWANQRVKLRVLRAWIKPPPQYRAPPPEDDSENSVEPNSMTDSDDGSLRFDTGSQQPITEKFLEAQTTRSHSTPATQAAYATKREKSHQNARKGPKHGNRIVDMTPEMMVDDDSQDFSGNSVFQSGRNSMGYLHRQHPDSYWTPWRRKLPSYRQPGYVQNPNSYGLVRPGFGGINDIYSNSLSGKLVRLPREPQKISTINATANASQSGAHRHRIFSRSVGSSMQAFMINRNPYSHVNTMTQVRFEQWLHMRMEEFHYAGRAVDVQLITQSYRLPGSVNENLGVLAQIAYYVAHFDWCYFSRSGHVHCSVKPDASITSQWFGCFPGSARVNSANGRLIPMRSLKIGDHVLTRDALTGDLIRTRVVGFLHRDEHAWRPNLRVTFNSSFKNGSICNSSSPSQLFLTPNHIVYIKQEAESEIKVTSIFAGDLKIGDTIFMFDPLTNSVATARVINLLLIAEWQPEIIGLYAPLTETGTMLIDNLLVSCFAQFTNEYIAYVVTWPLQLYYRLACWLKLDYVWPSWQHGVHWFLEWVYHTMQPWLSGTLFYTQT